MNLYLRNLVNNLKILYIAVVTGVTVNACTTYTNTVVAVYDNEKVLLKDKTPKDQKNVVYRLMDCSECKEKIKEKIPYLRENDPLTMQKSASLDPEVSMKPYDYEHTRVFNAKNTKIGLPDKILKERMQDSLRNKIIQESTRTMPVVMDTVVKNK